MQVESEITVNRPAQDVFDYIALVRDHYEKNGIGADYIDQLMR